VAARKRSKLAALVTIAAHAKPPSPELMRSIYDKISAESWRQKFPEGVALYKSLNPSPDWPHFFQALHATSIQGAQLGLFPLGSHVFHQEHPERVTPYVREFITSTV
jgi:hypothetical protein